MAKLKIGALAYYDSMQGMIPIKIDGVRQRDGNTVVTAKITKTAGAYHAGTFHEFYLRNVVPTSAVVVSPLGTMRIKAYTWERANPAKPPMTAAAKARKKAEAAAARKQSGRDQMARYREAEQDYFDDMKARAKRNPASAEYHDKSYGQRLGRAVRLSGRAPRIHVVFGSMERDGEFIVSRQKASKHYKSFASADKAARSWVAGQDKRNPASAKDEADEIVAAIKASDFAPYATGYVSTLGGAHRAAAMITISLDPRTQWSNGILENSRYAKFDVDCGEHKIEHISGRGVDRFRKASFKSPADAVAKLAKWAKGQAKANGARRNPHGEGPYTHFVVQPDSGRTISGWWNASDARDDKREWDPGYRLKVLTRAAAKRAGYSVDNRQFKAPA